MKKSKEEKYLNSNILNDEPDDEDDDEVIDYIEPGSEREKEGMRDARLTLVSMYVSLIVLSGLAMIVGALVFEHKLTYCIGVIIGTLAGCFYMWHLNRSLAYALNLGEDMAQKVMRKDIFVRLIAIILVDIIISAVIGGYTPIGVLASLLTLKLSLYLTPVTLRIIKTGKTK